MDLSIIIVNWNSSVYLEKCLDSVYANTPALGFEVIVVDNASFDGCETMLARKFPDVKFVQSRTNLGFSGANNLGLTEASGGILLFLNPDTEVVGSALSEMIAALERTREAGVIGALLLNSDGSVQTSCIQRFPTVWNQMIDAEFLRNAFPALSVWGTRPLLQKQQAPVPVDVISGACMMMRRSVFEQVGLFSPNYFMYSEDVDLCFKVRQVGLSNYYVDDAVVVHHGGASTSGTGQSHFSAVVMREALSRFFALRHGRLYAAAFRGTVVVSAIIRCALLLGSLLLVPRRGNGHRDALSRWIAVLGWGVGLNRIHKASSAKDSAQAVV